MELVTETDIDAPASTVWQILTEFAAYSEWNPFIRRAAGDLREGGRLELLMQAPGGKPHIFRPRLLRVSAGRELRWLGRLGLPRVFDGEHGFLIEPRGDRTVRLVQRETFRGLLVPLFPRRIWKQTRLGFEAMNRALKERAEASAI
jgi:hypothetical protein